MRGRGLPGRGLAGRSQTEPAQRLTALIRERLPATLIAFGRAVEAIRGRPG